MTNFTDLGIPFPLFEAPIREASEYRGLATCRLCGEGGKHCFETDELMQPCPSCGVDNGLDGDDRGDAPCVACRSQVPFPDHLRARQDLLVCYECLRSGKAALKKGTELGMVAWKQAFDGVTESQPDGPAVSPVDDRDDVRVPAEHLWELLRTPEMTTWQERPWLFCCRRPMTYLGDWRSTVNRLQPDDPRAFYEGLFNPDDDARGWGYEEFAEGSLSLYIYRCGGCEKHRATYDWPESPPTEDRDDASSHGTITWDGPG